MNTPLAYFITFTTYGTWVPGRDPGWVDEEHNQPGTPFLPPNASLQKRNREIQTDPAYTLDSSARAVVMQTIKEVCQHRGWELIAAHVRTNHVHLVVSSKCQPEKVMADIKAWCSRKLKEHDGKGKRRWTVHGSTLYLWQEEEVKARVEYVLNGQGSPMARYPSEPGA